MRFEECLAKKQESRDQKVPAFPSQSISSITRKIVLDMGCEKGWVYAC